MKNILDRISDRIPKTILLTGAGFTSNFGGFLADIMWEKIRNLIQRSKQDCLIQLFEKEKKYDYEKLYQKVVYGNEYNSHAKETFIKSVLKAYEELDGEIREYYCQQAHDNNLPILSHVKKFIERLAGEGNQKGFFFTLNQDIFIERYCTGYVKPICPGIIRKSLTRSTNLCDRQFNDNDYDLAPTENGWKKYEDDLKTTDRLYYVKLHGSYKWKNSKNEHILVIGTRKSRQIRDEPILTWNLQLFENILSLPERRLIIIGYGFRDPHINKVVADSIDNNKLKIIINCPTELSNFEKGTLKNARRYKDTIRKGILYYSSDTFKELFPYMPFPTQKYMKLVEASFN